MENRIMGTLTKLMLGGLISAALAGSSMWLFNIHLSSKLDESLADCKESTPEAKVRQFQRQLNEKKESGTDLLESLGVGVEQDDPLTAYCRSPVEPLDAFQRKVNLAQSKMWKYETNEDTQFAVVLILIGITAAPWVLITAIPWLWYAFLRRLKEVGAAFRGN